ncbi:IS630 family transposase [Catalinimonas sp. 4WD22]|uniref:IS630 family transposase n=1 Tax=Catalinimonas locisalis TaxID=3133978 RepID=UPI003101ADD5
MGNSTGSRCRVCRQYGRSRRGAVLDIYHQPYDATHPVIAMDEKPVQLVKETRQPMMATKNQPKRVDYEYERAGTASIFMFTEPLSGWRQATARPRRTKADWALEVAALVQGRYAEADKVTLVCDNLNTHTKGAFYEVFDPETARQLVKRIEFCYTPKHGSWLNVAENELSAMTRQCLTHRRIGDIETLQEEISAWAQDVNQSQRGVDWQLKIDDARCKLKSVYPNSLS